MQGASKLTNMKLQGLEGTMFNLKGRQYAQEIFALTFSIGTLLVLASLIPA
jgi:hypothetical protein